MNSLRRPAKHAKHAKTSILMACRERFSAVNVAKATITNPSTAYRQNASFKKSFCETFVFSVSLVVK